MDTGQVQTRIAPRAVFRRVFLLLALAVMLPLAAGCGHWPFKKKDPATGDWKGNWTYKMGKGTAIGGALDCRIDPFEKDAWKAVFEAEWGKKPNSPAERGSFKVELLGHREGDKIVFGGDVNLGASSGGVFNWTGEIREGVFLGDYKSRIINGGFELRRVDPEAKVGAKDIDPSKADDKPKP